MIFNGPGSVDYLCSYRKRVGQHGDTWHITGVTNGDWILPPSYTEYGRILQEYVTTGDGPVRYLVGCKFR